MRIKSLCFQNNNEINKQPFYILGKEWSQSGQWSNQGTEKIHNLKNPYVVIREDAINENYIVNPEK